MHAGRSTTIRSIAHIVMAESLVRAALIVLSERRGFDTRGRDAKGMVAREVIALLRSLVTLPHSAPESLPFSLDVYRDYFVLVAQWRDAETSIDARCTVDAVRSWLEMATVDERAALDGELVSDVWFWGGPCEWTCKLLDRAAALHAGHAVADELACIAGRLLDSLEAAAAVLPPVLPVPAARARSRGTTMALLGICIDVLAEIGWSEPDAEGRDAGARAARLLVELVWHGDEVESKHAAGLLERTQARRSAFSIGVALDVAAAIVERLSHELASGARGASSHGHARPLATGIDGIFARCLHAMLTLNEAHAIAAMRCHLLEPLLALLKPVLEFTADARGDDSRALELDSLVTRLFDQCSHVVDGDFVG